MRALSYFLVLMMAAGCGGRWGDVSFTDEGQLCFSQSLDAVTVEISAPECLSGSCTRNVEAMCDVTVDGSRIEITSEFSWEENRGPGPCTADCRRAQAECDLGPLADGTYTVVHGEEELELVVPLAMQGCPL